MLTHVIESVPSSAAHRELFAALRPCGQHCDVPLLTAPRASGSGAVRKARLEALALPVGPLNSAYRNVDRTAGAGWVSSVTGHSGGPQAGAYPSVVRSACGSVVQDYGQGVPAGRSPAAACCRAQMAQDRRRFGRADGDRDRRLQPDARPRWMRNSIRCAVLDAFGGAGS